MDLGKKGFYFSLDAFLGSILLVGGLVLLSQMVTQEDSTETIDFLSKDLLTSMTELKIKEINHSTITEMLNSGAIQNENNTLLEQLGEFWALNDIQNAENLTTAIMEQLLPERFGVSLEIDGDKFFYENNSVIEKNLINSRRMITGVKKGAALRGSTAAAYLKKIKQKRTSSFLYFGGFVGQGNLTGYIRDIPSDVNISDIVDMKIELDAEGAFELWINNLYCSNFVPITGNMTADGWDVTNCSSQLNTGDNKIELIFPDGVNTAYAAGGFVKVTYKTDQAKSDILTGNDKYWFPGIDGIINLYDSFFVPGNISSMGVYLHYIANHSVVNNTFHLTIGNVTVYLDLNTTTEQFIYLSDTNLSNMLNYSFLSTKTVPIRAGFENFTYTTEYSGNADVMVVTDVSGSMEWRFYDNNDGTRRNCDDANLNQSSTTRLSVAKCLDKQFATDIVNISGNEVGLVSYEETTHAGETVYPTTDLTLINTTVGNATPQTGYDANGATCICCGINSAYDVLSGSISTLNLIQQNQNWLYTTNGFLGEPNADAEGDEWYEQDYNDTTWSNGNAVLGSNENAIGPLITTDMGNTLGISALYPNLWDLAADAGTVWVDFTSGVNQTGNTFGESGGVNNDGWDSGFGYFGTTGTDVYMNIDPNEDGNQNDNTIAADDEIRIFIGNSWDDDAPSTDEIPDSGAVGIELNITQEMYNMMTTAGGTATLYFDWRIDPTGLDSGEEGWIKAQFGNSTNMNYLGTNMDENGTTSDATLDVFWCEDTGSSTPDPVHECPNPGGDTFTWNLSSYIAGPGWYYLVLGAKATEQPTDSTWDEDWRFYFDNVYIEFVNNTDKYYLRKHFNIADKTLAVRGVMNILSDDKVKAYVNGNLVHEDTTTNIPEYWNTRGVIVPDPYLKTGDNVVAVELSNSRSAAKFDLELKGLNDSRDLAMMVMTDGQANRQCARQNTGSSDQDAIQASCDAKEDFGMTVYAVGFSDNADQDTLQGMAVCGGGVYKKSDDIAELQEFYKDVAQTIISASRQSQTVVVSGGFAESTLYSDSYVEFNYTPAVEQAGANEISVTFQSDQLQTCSPTVNVYSGIRILDAKVTSYSGEHWTDLVKANGNVAYNLSEHDSFYIRLGDPFIVNIPPQLLSNGNNVLNLKTGDEPINNSGCSANNTFIYTAAVNLSTSRSNVVENAEGCEWTVEFESGGTQNFTIPLNYNGTKVCSYTSTLIDYDDTDAYDIATFTILDQLDFDKDGRVFVDFFEQDLEIVVTLITQVPYLWGPAIAEVNMWN